MKIKIVTPDSTHAQAWGEALSAGGSFKVGTVVHALHEVNVLVNGSRPDLVVVEVLTPRDFDALEALAAAHPEIDYVLIGNELTSELLMRAMRAGVREVLPAPASAEAVLAAVKRQTRKRPAAATASDEKRGEVLAFVSCKGGSGATFTAANLAFVLAAGGQRRVALIDMNLQFGDALLFLSSEQAASNVADVARNIQRLDRDLLLAAMVPVAPGLHVLAAPDDPALASDVLPEHVQAIVAMARTMFDYIVIDSGRSLSAVTLQSLDLADHVYAVLQLTLPFIRDGKRLRDVFSSLGYPAQKVHWVVNRYEKNSEITLDDLKTTLGVGKLVTLPNQYDVVASSVNQGVAVTTVAPASPISRALRDWAQRIAPQADKPRGGWFANLRRGSAPPPAGRA